MTYQQFRTHFLSFEILSLQEIKRWHPNFDQRRLVEWQEKNYLERIVRGWYRFTEKNSTSSNFFTIANKIYDPSYISLESALSYYNLIPEGVYQITSVSTNKTTTFSTKIGSFSYNSMAKKLFFGYKLQGTSNNKFKIATMEKTILDYCYFHNELDLPETHNELRLNHDILQENINHNLLNKYLKRWNSPTLTTRVKLLLKTTQIKDINHA